MGSLFELVDFGENEMARKFVSHKKPGGLEAPRNSLDLPVEVSQRLCTGGNNNILCAYHMTNGWSDKNSYTPELPIKKLINEEIGRRPNKGRNAPSVVARLMGVDTLPLDSKPVLRQNKKKNETKISNSSEEEEVREVPIDRITLTTNSSRHKKLSSFDGYEYCDQDRWSDSSMKLDKPKPREHPQEEELQKFKKEFEAWQSARFRECSRVVELGIPQSQWLAQQNLNREKMAFYAKSTELKAYPQERSSLQLQKNKTEDYADEQKNSFFLKSINSKTDLKETALINSSQKFEKVSGPTKIVILRPGFDDFDTKGASWASSPGISEDRGSMEDFLEEVKERLRHEMQGKSSKRSTIARGGGIETPYSEKSPDARQLAQRIAKQVRESVTRDLGVSLPRSESTRSYRSEIQFDGTGSPEFINRDTRRFLTERLRNVLKEETCRDIPRAVHGCSRLGLSSKEKMRTEESSGTRNEMKNKSDMQSSSFRKDNDDDDDDDDDVKLEAELSPRNLIRSLSAPVSGTSFGKLLLEDRHILTGAHIRRKHEAIEKVTLNAKKRRKEKFNLKEKVSSFKYSFILRGKLFGKKLPSLEESPGSKHNFNAPTVTMNLYERHENSTEVPPSPASVCSSVNEEFWRPGDNFSPASTPDVHPLDESDMPRVFREISSNLSELRRQLNQLETGIPGEAVIDDQPLEDEMMEIKDNAEAYIRDLLIASGLYDGSCDKYLSRWDPLGKPISNHVFEVVEESYRQKTKGNEHDQGEKLNHKLLCDLLNEALSSLIGAPLTMSRFMKKATGPLPRPPQGRKLLDRVWEMTRAQIYPAPDESYHSLESIVARDLKSTPWTGLIDEDVNALGKDIESQITGDLIHEIIKDMQPLS